MDEAQKIKDSGGEGKVYVCACVLNVCVILLIIQFYILCNQAS